MIDPVVRPARRDDVDELRSLEAEARAGLHGQRGGDRWLATHDQRGSAWGSGVEAGGIDVAVIGDVVVGYLVLTCRPPVASIEEVYVTPEARQVGFGDALIESAMTRARAAGCALIEGEALPGDRETKNLYERAGITARLIVVSKAL